MTDSQIDLTKVGIVGLGFVGGALKSSFEHRSSIQLYLYDKYKDGGVGTLEELLEAQVIFLCLPTLYVERIDIKTEFSGYDLDAIHQTCQALQSHDYKGLVVIKSTVEPSASQRLADTYGLKIVHNPEFLTARTAREDFERQGHIVLGATKQVSKAEVEPLVKFYRKYWPEAEISLCVSNESESMKIFVNSFYAMKVQIFNEFYLLCQKQGTDFDNVVELMLKNGWINPMHTKVPGPDGQLSYGGCCFPKDTKALAALMYHQRTPHHVLEACIEEQKEMRRN